MVCLWHGGPCLVPGPTEGPSDATCSKDCAGHGRRCPVKGEIPVTWALSHGQMIKREKNKYPPKAHILSSTTPVILQYRELSLQRSPQPLIEGFFPEPLWILSKTQPLFIASVERSLSASTPQISTRSPCLEDQMS